MIPLRHAALYVLENGASVHWRKVGIEGFFYLLKRYALPVEISDNFRSAAPAYRILLMNQTDSGEGDFTQSLDEDIRFEVKQGTFFYQYVQREIYLFFIFVRLGESGNVRGLWFHDRDFMPRFVSGIEKIYAEQNLRCDGTYDRESYGKPVRELNSHSGKAILQMLRKDSSPVEEQRVGPLLVHSDQSHVTPADSTVELLRRELSIPGDPPLLYANVSFPSGSFPSSQSVDVSHRLEPLTNAMLATSDSVTISRNDLKDILVDMISSEGFVNELFNRLKQRSTNF